MLTELFHVKPKLFWLFIMKTDFQCEAEMLMTLRAKSKVYYRHCGCFFYEYQY